MTATLVPTLAALVEQLDAAVRAPGIDVPHAIGDALAVPRLFGDPDPDTGGG